MNLFILSILAFNFTILAIDKTQSKFTRTSG